MHTTLKFRRSPSKCIHSGHCHCQCDWVALWENWHKNTSKNTAAYDRDIPFNSLIILKGLGEFRIRIRLGAPLRLASFLWRVGCGVELVNWLDCLDVWMLRCIDMLGCMFGCVLGCLEHAWMFGCLEGCLEHLMISKIMASRIAGTGGNRKTIA